MIANPLDFRHIKLGYGGGGAQFEGTTTGSDDWDDEEDDVQPEGPVALPVAQGPNHLEPTPLPLMERELVFSLSFTWPLACQLTHLNLEHRDIR